jgi:Ca2+/Na+ antiporter
VVVASVAQNRSSLALGNVLGSSISNILGAFSLGLLFHPGHMEFDSAAQIYTSILFALTTVFTALALFGTLDRAIGGSFITLFVVYLFSIGCAIYRGVLDAPDDPDDDIDEDTINNDEEQAVPEQVPTETSALVQSTQPPTPPKRHGLTYHIIQLIVGFLALSLSGYVLSHSAASLADSLNLSGTVLGVTILAFATTLPEKFVAVISGARGHEGIVVANTAGSNIFLLTLCLGITFLTGNQDELADSFEPFEILVTWAASAIFFLIVFLGSNRWVGALLLVLYVAFLVLELTIFRR